MSDSNNGFTWESNTFWLDIKQRLEKVWSNASHVEMTADVQQGVWRQRCSHTGAGQIAFLQNKYMAVDFTDRGFGICPMILGGRYYGRIGFDIEGGGSVFCTHPWDRAGKYGDLEEINTVFGSDSFILRGNSPYGFEYEMKVSLPPSYPFILVEMNIRNKTCCCMTVKPWLLWAPGELRQPAENTIWLNPRHMKIADRTLAGNNSRTADPVRPEDPVFAGIGIAYADNAINHVIYKRMKPEISDQVILCDRLFSSGELEELTFEPILMELEDGAARFSMLLGICAGAEEFGEELSKWYSLGNTGQEKEKRYWKDILADLSIHCPDSGIELQSTYSVRNSLFSRSMYNTCGTVFVHGRPDRGYGDCSKLHQSYQMHYVALASGQVDSVKEEIAAFAQLQEDSGNMAIQLRPGSGCHPYAGLYSNAHFIMVLYRYLSWTGDFDFVNETAVNPNTGIELSILDRAVNSAQWLLNNFEDGVVKPCGWLDAWPPKVKAQAQISIVSYIAIEELSKILAFLEFKEEGARFGNAARKLADRIKEVFYNQKTGLFAEHLFESGKVEGGVIEDFWAHTQIWAALAGLAPDAGGLEVCRKYCLKSGMTVIPETGINTDYIRDSTDGLEDLDLGSTATWLFAAWPELTHLYAAAEIKYGRTAEALEAVRCQLPRNIYKENPHAAPYYYAEKYLYPYDIPWLCTWSGDPTLIQVLLEGFGGIQPALEGLRISPGIPEAWRDGGDYKINFLWRGRKIQLEISGYGTNIKSMELNGSKLKAGMLITPDMLQEHFSNIINISMGEPESTERRN